MKLPSPEYQEKPTDHLNGRELKISAYNIERGFRIDSIIEKWLNHPLSNSDVVLLSECDNGMVRTQNRHVAREFADALGYSYAYAPEFIELTKGKGSDKDVPGENTHALHGNAILSRYPLSNIEIIPLPSFMNYLKCEEKRIGSRNALVADVEFPEKKVTVATTHLESHSSPYERDMQLEAILKGLSSRDKGQPLILGGDMNTSGLNVHNLYRELMTKLWKVINENIEKLEKREPLLRTVRKYLYDYKKCNVDSYTLKNKIYKAHLDWFFVKNKEAKNPKIHKSFEDRNRYSDHLPISLELRL